MHKGWIEVNSEENTGTTFSVVLDLAYEGTHAPVINDAHHSVSFTGYVWVIDDDLFILQLCDAILTKYNIVHQVFSSPEPACHCCACLS